MATSDDSVIRKVRHAAGRRSRNTSGPRVCLFILFTCLTGYPASADDVFVKVIARPGEMTSAQLEDGWVRPAATQDAEPRWGIEDGIQFGIWPSGGGPRGLIRVYAPYLGFPDDRVVNFIAIEPMKRNARSFSELERSLLDDVNGLRFWSEDSIEAIGEPKLPWRPAQGQTRLIPDAQGGHVQALTVVIVTERFRTGTQAAVEVTIRQDRPHELRLRTFILGNQRDIDACVLTATMGNFMRLRKLWLRDEVVTSHGLFPNHRGNNFTPHHAFDLDQLFRTPDGGMLLVATPDEQDLTQAVYDPAVHHVWRYAGRPGAQYWRMQKQDITETLRAQVNARFTYWASNAPIPGGVSFENFELVDQYHEGQTFIFGISDVLPKDDLHHAYQPYTPNQPRGFDR